MANSSTKGAKIEVADELRDFLLEKADVYERLDFIPDDPISIPHRFSARADIEISGFIAATLAWGQRKTIMHNASAFIERMDNAPAAFLEQANSDEMTAVARGFVHRTFQPRDAELFLHALQGLYREFGSLEAAFLPPAGERNAHGCIAAFHERFFAAAAERGFEAGRTRKHVATPVRGSAAKRLNMYLRWMVRSAARGVDFGLWSEILPSDLMMPLDVHTGNIGRKLGLLNRKQNDWRAVEELTNSLRTVDADDPVRLDFALFGLGAIEKF